MEKKITRNETIISIQKLLLLLLLSVITCTIHAQAYYDVTPSALKFTTLTDQAAWRSSINGVSTAGTVTTSVSGRFGIGGGLISASTANFTNILNGLFLTPTGFRFAGKNTSAPSKASASIGGWVNFSFTIVPPDFVALKTYRVSYTINTNNSASTLSLGLYYNGASKGTLMTTAALTATNQTYSSTVTGSSTYPLEIRISAAAGKLDNMIIDVSDIKYEIYDAVGQAITFNALSTKTYGDGTSTLSATGGSSTSPVVFSSSNDAVATCTGTNGTTLTIVGPGTCNINANQAAGGGYTAAAQVAQPLTVNPKTLTITTPAATTKVYTGTNAAVITGSLTGILNSDDVTLNGTGTFASVNVLDGIAVTSTSTLGGTNAGNYTLTQPTGLSANITKAPQTISFGALSAVKVGDADFAPGATSITSGTNAITYSTSNPAVATIALGKIHIVGQGNCDIYADQVASTNYDAATRESRNLTVHARPTVSLSGISTSANLTSPTADITVSSGTLTVSANNTVNNITVEPGAKVEVEVSSNQLVVNDLTMNAGFLGNLYDGFSTSSIKVGGSGIKVNGRLRYVRTFDDTQWYFVSFPYDVTVSEITSNVSPFILGTDWFVKYYDGAQRATGTTSGNWKHISESLIPANQTTLHAKRGYVIGIASGTMSLTFPMISNTTIAAEVDKTIDVTYYGSANAGVAESHKGWNLIGQPFLSKFDAGASLATNIAHLVFSDGGTSKTYTAKLPSEITRLNPFVSFFVQAGATLETDKASFATNGRQLARSLVEPELSDRVRIYFNTATGSDNTNLLMDNSQTTAYQIGQDLEKWIGTETAKPQIYTTLSGVNYAYNGLPMTSVVNLPLGIYTQTSGSTTIQADASLAPSLSKLLLTDNGVTPAIVTDLLTTNYTFTAAEGTNNTRFQITAQRVATDNNVTRYELNEIGISMVNGRLVFANISPFTIVRVYDALGRMVANKTVNGNSLEINLNARGIYTVQLQSGTSISTRKVIL